MPRDKMSLGIAALSDPPGFWAEACSAPSLRPRAVHAQSSDLSPWQGRRRLRGTEALEK